MHWRTPRSERGAPSSRKPFARATPRSGRQIQEWRIARSGCDRFSRTRHRHRNGRPGIQIGSPRSIAIALQRIGRSGHGSEQNRTASCFPLPATNCWNARLIVHAISGGELDRIEIPQNALDILAQQIVAETAGEHLERRRSVHLFRKAYPYRDLQRCDFEPLSRCFQKGSRLAWPQWTRSCIATG